MTKNNEAQKRFRKKNPQYYKKFYKGYSEKSKAITYRYRFGGNREKALERDNWSCVKCGMNNEQHILIFGRSITIDHIDGRGRNSDNPNHELNNLQTLCLRCHGIKDIERRVKY